MEKCSRPAQRDEVRTSLIHIIDRLVRLVDCKRFRIVALSRGTAALGHYDQLMAWDVVLLNGFANDFLGHAITIDIGSIPLYVWKWQVSFTAQASLIEFNSLAYESRLVLLTEFRPRS